MSLTQSPWPAAGFTHKTSGHSTLLSDQGPAAVNSENLRSKGGIKKDITHGKDLESTTEKKAA